MAEQELKIGSRNYRVDELIRRLYLILITRLFLGLLFFGFVAISYNAKDGFPPDYPVRALYIFSILLLTFTAVGGLTFKLFSEKTLPVYAACQVGFDIVAVFVFVCLSGGVHSPFVLFFVPVILLSSLVLGLKGSFCTALVATLAYGIMSLLQTYPGLLALLGFNLSVPEADATRAFSSFITNGVTLIIAAVTSGLLVEKWRGAEGLVGVYVRKLTLLRKLHQHIIEHIPSGIILAGLDGRILYANKAAERILFRKAEHIRGQSMVELFPELNEFVEWARKGHADELSRRELTYKDPERGDLILGCTISTVFEERGTPKLLMVFQDITAVKQAEKEIRAMEELKLVATAASEIAHNVKNPLGAISGAAQMLRQELASGGDAELCERLTSIIVRESERLDDAIRTLLFVSRSTLKSPEVTELDVEKELRRILTSFRGKEPSYEIHLHGSETLYVRIDRSNLEVIIWTLLENAVEAMPEGGNIFVSLDASTDGRWVEIHVRDEGPGVSVDTLENLFRPFYTTKSTGTGLGLCIARQHARRAGGDLEYIPEEKGAHFCVRLPRFVKAFGEKEGGPVTDKLEKPSRETEVKMLS
ncbi:ATP-binding protein [Thermodesulforhabdus norvegica]|uniref:histidine kinase n=1 Tax=Thermodesulforhabdus norvegica TaxID=39841 RepID=A0A1I4QZT4_9BACT|nr:ATP-binding protein [Thermodesulforhabdus norvegica]SFM45517.1 two-component system, NtrC family, sensor histidine kinase PilS [Thermodesulforhabdus norvegica]